jgi:hypothetical protein
VGGWSRRDPHVLAALIEARSLSLPGLGFLLAADKHRQEIELCVAHGATPALVTLLSTDRKGSIRVVLPHGRTWPALDLEPEAGHA